MVFGGYLASVGALSLPIVIALSTAGAAAGFMTMYWIGSTVGEHVIEKNRLKWVKKRHLDRARVGVEKWGFGIVLLNRFLSGFRAVISLTVGMAQMNKRLTLICATISGAIWTATIAYVGYLLGENWEQVRSYLRDYGRAVMVLIACGALIQLVRFALRERKKETDGEIGDAD